MLISYGVMSLHVFRYLHGHGATAVQFYTMALQEIYHLQSDLIQLHTHAHHTDIIHS